MRKILRENENDLVTIKKYRIKKYIVDKIRYLRVFFWGENASRTFVLQIYSKNRLYS